MLNGEELLIGAIYVPKFRNYVYILTGYNICNGTECYVFKNLLNDTEFVALKDSDLSIYAGKFFQKKEHNVRKD